MLEVWREQVRPGKCRLEVDKVGPSRKGAAFAADNQGLDALVVLHVGDGAR